MLGRQQRKVFVPFDNQRVFTIAYRPIDHFLTKNCRAWLDETCGSRWSGSGWACDWNGWVFTFTKSDHALMFKLAWGGQ